MPIQHRPRWAVSRLGRPIELYHSPGQLSDHRGALILIGGVHGDEPEGVRLAEETLAWLKSQYSSPQSSAASQIQQPWILIPCLNVDGYAAGTRVNGAGVDLNRNYPSRSWSSESKEPRYFPGPSPGSEPEIQAVVALIALVSPRLIIHCHSWKPCVVLTGEPGRSAAQALARASGYPLQDSIGYETPGSLSQYGWHDHKIPIICIEEAEGTALPKVWSHFRQGMEAIFLGTADGDSA